MVTPPADGAGSLEARLENLEREREFLLVHSRNLERELRRLARRRDRDGSDPAPDAPVHERDLEARLVAVTTAYDAVVNSRTWRAFAPYRALRGWVLRSFRR